MPKRADLKSILLIGAGPIVIGQACEFDYAGTQACKALKEEGFKIILVNSNPATIMTDPEMADVTYVEPITVDVLERIIAKEKPCALLPTLGGQTALNCALALVKAGILKKYNVELIGASAEAIHLAENRDLFQNLMKQIGLQVPHSIKILSLTEAKRLQNKITFPVVIRSSYSLGGSGAGIVYTADEFIAALEKAFMALPDQEISIDAALLGWKEFELEVIRDKNDNCIVVCGVENFDPLGVHTGDSITVAPIQTLTDKEYQAMRQAAFSILRAVGVDTGGSNVQFAVHPQTGEMVVIEMNPRVSRSSALVSKASGFPIAKIAAKLAVGYTLDELKNDITGDQLPASFEPSLDYVAVKIPRFNAEKFPGSSDLRGLQMRSVGEVLAMGRTFPEALQKAMRSLEVSQDSFGKLFVDLSSDELKKRLQETGPLQLWMIGEALRRKISIQEIAQITQIDSWFLAGIDAIITAENLLATLSLKDLSKSSLKVYKQLGFTNARLAKLLHCSQAELNELCETWQITPVFKRIDSCAGEFGTETAYFYSTYEQSCEANPSDRAKMLIIGSGPNRIGQGIEFDYCCVHAAKTLRAAGFETIMINCNPETVSTDYDVVDRLYCSPLTLEDVLAIIKIEKPVGVFLQYGGQTPLQLAEGLAEANIPLLGIDVNTIQETENRKLFQHFLQALNLKQPQNASIYHIQEAEAVAHEIGFPLIVRPSFVLGGAAMSIVNDMAQLQDCLKKAFAIHAGHPVLIEKFLDNAIEIDVDAIADGTDVFIPCLLQHIESAGIHSGDSACITPPVDIALAMQAAIKQQVKTIALALDLHGIFNVQFAIQDDEIYILEVNPRASRTLPFLCKTTGLPLVAIATQCVLGKKLAELNLPKTIKLPFYSVKETVLPFDKFSGTPAFLGPEMKSTGEVMGIGKTKEEAYAKAQMATGNMLPKQGSVWIIANTKSLALHLLAFKLHNLGFKLCITQEHAAFLKNIDLIDYQIAEAPSDLPANCNLIIAINQIHSPNALTMHAVRFALEKKICHATTLNAAHALVDAIEFYLTNDYEIYSLQSKHHQVTHQNETKHFLTGEELDSEALLQILRHAAALKKMRDFPPLEFPLKGKTLALLFDKPSLRTRFSFSTAMRELGGDVIESVGGSRKSETPEDQARVLSGYCHAAMVRTFQDDALIRMAHASSIPIINGLSDLHHPCQILADLLTLLEMFNRLQGLTLSYIGDGNNILHSLLLLAPKLGVTIHYCCPQARGPNQAILERSLAQVNKTTGQIKAFSEPHVAVVSADAIYTDVWTSMGFENKSEEHLFAGFQVNEQLMQSARPHAIFMHCLPMERGKEVCETLPDEPCSVIFRQSENRLHVQKALLLNLLEIRND